MILTTGFLWGGYIVNSTIPNRSTNTLLLATFLFFTLVCFALLLETFFVRIRYSVWGLLTSSPWRPSREVPWHSITSCRWCGSYEWHVLETRGYGKVRLHSYLAGLPEFFSMLEEKRPELFGEDEPT
ncbi:MAG: hypothetical protein RRA15_10720 [bacterium]|nr:hypothetical protein [bacterium]MDT8366949.1 hypothetical protein [bacterium]